MEDLIKILDIIIWPATVIVISLVYKTETRKLISRLSSLKYKELEASFNKSLNKIEKDSIELQADSNIVLRKIDDEIENRLDRLIDISPKAAILEAWSEIEGLGYKLGLTTGATIRTRVNPRAIVEFLESTGEFAPNQIKLIEDLRKLRNKVSHIPDIAIERDDAERFMTISKKVIILLEMIIKQKN